MRIGLIGLGGISASHLDAWRTLQTERAALGDQPLEVHTYDHSPLPTSPDWTRQHHTRDSLLAAVDVVDICTPTSTHTALIRAAADAGCDVICEKPLALDLNDAVAAIRDCQDHQVRLLVGQVVRYFGEYAAAHRAVRSGAYGEPAVLSFRRASAQPSGNNWMEDETQSGGIAVDLMLHDLDQAIWFAGPVTQVFGQATLPKRGGALTYGLATLTHRSGAISRVIGSWALAGGFETSFDIACSAGMLSHDSSDHAQLRVDRSELSSVAGLLPVLLGDTPFTHELRDFLAVLEQGARPRVSAVEAAQTLAVALAVRESMRTGLPQTPAPVPDDLAWLDGLDRGEVVAPAEGSW